MRRIAATSWMLLLAGSSHSFMIPSQKATYKSISSNDGISIGGHTALFDRKGEHDGQDIFNQLTKNGMSVVVAAAIFTSALLPIDGGAAANAADRIELSRGAFVLEATAPKGESILKAQIDSKSLIKTIYVNRKDLKASLNRIQSSVSNELNSAVWSEVRNEFMAVEGDVIPAIKVIPPSDWRQTIRDLSKGKLNFVLNGEIVNVAVEPDFGAEEDNLVIRVKGYKGEQLPDFLLEERESTAIDLAKGPIAKYVGQFQEFWSYWNAPVDQKYMPKGATATNGGILILSSLGSILLMYVISYGYYVDLKSLETRQAETKRKVNAGKAKAAREAKEAAAAKAAKAAAADKQTTDQKEQEKDSEFAARIAREEEYRLVKEKSEQQFVEMGAKARADYERAKREREAKKTKFRFRFWKKD